MKSPLSWGLIALFSILLFTGVGCAISQSNHEVQLRNSFEQKKSERTAFYDKMWKTISQKGQVALRNDSSFRENVNIIMAGRKDAPGLFMKWVTETNPNANYQEVSALYKDLSRSIEANREGFFEQEKTLQDIKREHDNLLSMFPSSVVLSILGRQHLDYRPITSDRTDGVIKSGKDNNTDVF